VSGAPPFRRRPTRPRDEEGWFLFDVLLGALILTVGLIAVMVIFNSSAQSIGLVSSRQAAVTVATSTLSVAAAYGCGFETGLSLPGTPPSTPSAGYPYTNAIWTQCSSVYTGSPGSAFPGELGDPPSAGVVSGGTTYDWSKTVNSVVYYVRYQAIWTQGAAGTTGCPDTLTGGSAAIGPVGETRVTTVQWVARDQAHLLTLSTFGATPTNAVVYSGQTAGGILVTGMAAGSVAQLRVPVTSFDGEGSGTVLVDRRASPGSGAPGSGCAWFPYLPPMPGGTYGVKYFSNGNIQGTPTATAPDTLEVTAGSITSWAA
jgi:hypothetical protein